MRLCIAGSTAERYSFYRLLVLYALIYLPPTPFSQSPIWTLQRQYFGSMGPAAWQTGEVPHYITSNPVVGKTYAELVLALLRDLSLQGKTTETVYLLELGAGHGRLCYHFFKHFEKYYKGNAFQLPPVCYVLSDFTEANVAFWQGHPRLQPYFEQGWLDVALFDAETDSNLYLQRSKKHIISKSLSQPLVVLANYFFDSIPQELFYISNGKIKQCLVSLSSVHDPEKVDTSTLIHSLELEYTHVDAPQILYPAEPYLERLINTYIQKLDHTYLLFPDAGIRCVHRLNNLSQGGTLILSADKGVHHLHSLENLDLPRLSKHGSFSLQVNYHAFRIYTSMQGGTALFPPHQPLSLDLGCILLLDDRSPFQETLHAYERFVNDYGPDDYFSLKKLVEKHLDTLTYQDIIGTIRLSAYDARIFLQMKPHLQELLAELSDKQRFTLFMALIRIWDTYYPLQEARDLAAAIGECMLDMGFFAEALLYFEKSIFIYEPKPSVLYLMAVCHDQLGAHKQAELLIEKLRIIAPEYVELKTAQNDT